MHKDLIESRTIKNLAVRDHDADFSGVPYVFERVALSNTISATLPGSTEPRLASIPRNLAGLLVAV
jgi:hypothetical protein